MLIYFNAIFCFADLKSYFSQGSSSTPSTHGSGVGLEALEREEVVLQTQVESTDVVAVPMPVEDVEGQAGGGVNSSRELLLPCENDIPIPNMEDNVPRFGRSRKGGRNNITQDHYFRVDTFYATIDAITTEFDHRFNEVSSELLTCFACLDPRESFSKFDVNKLARLTEIYLDDFSFDDRKK